MKVKRIRQKHILKRAFSNELPKEILHRGKAGFGMPLADWLRHELRALAEDTLLTRNSGVSDFVQPEKIKLMLEEHMTGRRNWHIQLWRLLVLESWLKGNSTRLGSQYSSECREHISSIGTHTSASLANAR